MPILRRAPRSTRWSRAACRAKLNFVVIAKTSAERLSTFGRVRGWRHMRLLSSDGTTFKRDYGGETPDGDQMPMLNVFHRGGDTIRHSWSSELLYAPSDPGLSGRSSRLGT